MAAESATRPRPVSTAIPNPSRRRWWQALEALYGVGAGTLLVTRGSDEAIDVLSRIYLRAGVDAILQCPPTFGMYQVAARIQGASVIDVPLDRGARLGARRRARARAPGSRT